MRVLPWCCLLLSLLVLSGCAGLRAPAISGEPDRALQAKLEGITRWQLEGKLAVRSPAQSDSARVQWRQDGEAFDIHLSGPAGLKATHLFGMPGGVVFEQGARREQAGSVEVLSERLIGWPLPADDLTAWLRGLPSPARRTAQVVYAPEGWLAHLVQDDWEIDFSDYRQADGVALPGRIEAQRGELKITLIIKQWQLP